MAQRTRSSLPPGPDEVLRHLLMKLSMTQDQLADSLGVSRLTVNQLANRRRSVTAEMALRLSRAFGTTPEFWLNLQRNIDLAEARRRIQDTLEAVPQLRKPQRDVTVLDELADE